MDKTLKLSIIILAYNEETYLKSCLEAIARQTVGPDEVIVVDNNSTDKTVEIAKRFDFVRVVHEAKQGMIPARNTGFEAAQGNVLARIDADSHLEPDWVQQVHKLFANQSVDAVGGLALTKTLWFDLVPHSRLWSLMYMWWTEAEFGVPILWGPNMALRRSAWQTIKSEVCLDDKLVHEDQDLSYLLAGHGKKVIRSNKLLIRTDGDHFHDWAKLSEYVHRRWSTKHYHLARGTLNNSSANKLSLPERLLRLIGVFLPGLAFIITSPIQYGLKLILLLPSKFKKK